MRDSLNRWLRLSATHRQIPTSMLLWIQSFYLRPASNSCMLCFHPSPFRPLSPLSRSLKRLGYLRGIELEAPHPPTRLSTMREARKEFRVVAAQMGASNRLKHPNAANVADLLLDVQTCEAQTVCVWSLEHARMRIMQRRRGFGNP